MKLDARRPLVVLLGAWNPAVLNPGWVALHLLGKKENTNIDVMMVNPPNSDKTIFYLDQGQIGYYADNTKVELYLKDYSDQSIADLCLAAQSLIQKLPHTPFGDYGVNINFLEENPSDDVIDKLSSNDHLDHYFKVGAQEFMARIKYANKCQLNFKRISTDKGAAFEFNYHHTVTDLADLFKILKPYIIELIEKSKKTMVDVYGLHSDEEISHKFAGIQE